MATKACTAAGDGCDSLGAIRNGGVLRQGEPERRGAVGQAGRLVVKPPQRPVPGRTLYS